MNEPNKTSGETDLARIVQSLNPKLNDGEFVFCNVQNPELIDITKVLCFFREPEGHTVVVEKQFADAQRMSYSFVAAWITLTVHSSLEAVGLTALFSTALANHHISCNVVAATFHDHIFVNIGDADKAMTILKGLTV